MVRAISTKFFVVPFSITEVIMAKQGKKNLITKQRQ